MQFNMPSSRTASSGTTDSSRSYGRSSFPLPFVAHADSPEKDKAVVPDSAYSLEEMDITKSMTFATALPEV